jgi:hypothetical protein
LPHYFWYTFLCNYSGRIDSKKETISLKVGEDEIKFHFSKYKNQLYHNKPDVKEGKTIAELAAMSFCIQEDDLIKKLIK